MKFLGVVLVWLVVHAFPFAESKFEQTGNEESTAMRSGRPRRAIASSGAQTGCPEKSVSHSRHGPDRPRRPRPNGGHLKHGIKKKSFLKGDRKVV